MQQKISWRILASGKWLLSSYLLISVSVLLAHSSLPLEWADKVSASTTEDLRLLGGTVSDFMNSIDYSHRLTSLLVFLLWGVIGGLIFSVIYVFVQLRNEIVIDTSYVNRPPPWKALRGLGLLLIRFLLKLIFGILIVVTAVVFFYVILPFAVGLFLLFTDNLHNPIAWLLPVLSVCIITFNMHLLVVLTRLLLGRNSLLELT